MVHISVPVAAKELQDGFPDASVPEVAAFLPVQHPEVAIPLGPRAWDASAAVHPGEALDAVILALVAAPYAEKLVAPEPAVPALAVVALPPLAEAPCTPDAGRSAA